MEFPQFDPVALNLFGLPLRWYGLAYVAGFFAALYSAKFLVKKSPAPNLEVKYLDDYFLWAILGVVLGGRLGFVLFYDPAYYLDNPVDILKTWHGGMSFHGGFLGVVLTTYIFTKRRSIKFFDLTDRMAPGICFGLLFGRIANFINGELWGKVTTSPLGMVFPHGGELPRHPSQLYEAALEGLVLAIILHIVALYKPNRGLVTGLFAIGYGLARYSVEFFREPSAAAFLPADVQPYMSMGQLLSVPMVFAGLYVIWWSRKHG